MRLNSKKEANNLDDEELEDNEELEDDEDENSHYLGNTIDTPIETTVNLQRRGIYAKTGHSNFKHTTHDATMFNEREVRLYSGKVFIMTLIPLLCFLPLCMEDMKHSEYAIHYGNQSTLCLALLLASFILYMILGEFIGAIVFFLALALTVMTAINAHKGKVFRLPVIGKLDLYQYLCKLDEG